MKPGRLLVDVDALTKLSHWQLASELPVIFDLPPQRICTLPSVLPRASKAVSKPDGKLFHNSGAAQRLIPLLHQLGKLPAADPADLQLFADTPRIDGGEAVLFSLAMRMSDAIILTGDKKALGALSELPYEVRGRLTGKIVCLEQVVLYLAHRSGLTWLRDRICAERHIDKTIAVLMGSKCDAMLDSVVAGCKSYIVSNPGEALLANFP